jgi:putative tricarboxylic transport membrane protein
MNSRTAGLVAAVLFLAIGGGQIYMALALPRGTLAEPGPGVFPLLVGALMSTSSLACLVLAVLECNPLRLNLLADAARPAVLVAVLAAFLLLLPRVGFVLPSLLLQVVTLQVFGMRGVWRRLAVAAVTTAAAVLLFETLLGVQFPTPSWSF